MLVRKNEPRRKGFLGAAKTTDKPLYRPISRTPDMYPFGDKSNFITPKSPEDRAKSSKGIKR